MAIREQTVELPDVRVVDGRPFGLYVHVPFCVTRCGYCDFNTYTPAELGGVNPDAWLGALRTELELAAARLRPPPVNTVFVGGGTPSLLGGARLALLLDMVREHFALAPDAEITTEANPESTWPEFFDAIRAAGYTRVSLGMQSVAPRVLGVLDRIHTPNRSADAAREALAAGFEHVSLDLIYGTPGESDEDLLWSLDTAIETGVDHVSAYALVVEEGTALARRVRRGELAAPDDDVLAHRYELVDARLSQAGLSWYEVSNWSRPGGQCRHNLGYWDGGQWWGAGPGAHGYVGTTRWWNVKHPNAYAERLNAAALPVAGFEQLGSEALHTEDVLLKIRLRQGLPVDLLNPAERERVQGVVADGLLVRDGDRLVLTPRGRLLADGVVRTLLG
ncbi:MULTISPECIES: radical SAM family heme chaperone HemW [Mycobacterium avium complex (MAC)]|jgi:oxygen-independent coproporphyrinogen-3 oxidase|uniref:Heme chaperone HemW n=6 Tax=Mycobacterium avium TaxID=1764 RepID=A0A2U2E818_MYCAV|nr:MULTISPECIES: radical SAM family heme chaperone HemW [Mycobacterium avium complex (MAC)]ETB10791.1 coproporphyrinogen III oxidase [Mycobacterium avium subsp. silvaticum ATCC 49884]ETB17606.1 coproporphyrinogen III oxidase [Mycobacterium avium subsp. avium 10-9275]TXA41229.1 coproporphyrinogen III oxidase [Mycobacterium tuberculosis variant bovis]ABK65587.1 putative oxygen-independent coproporphyrinogen III oxidase [Mycobacterium avium 104]ANR89883.1 coproporphyrinogen III oxidase [Mycobacte